MARQLASVGGGTSNTPPPKCTGAVGARGTGVSARRFVPSQLAEIATNPDRDPAPSRGKGRRRPRKGFGKRKRTPGEPRIVAAGVDSLYLSVYVQPHEEQIRRLEVLKELAQAERARGRGDSWEPPCDIWGGVAFEVAPAGSHRYGLRLRSADWIMQVAAGGQTNGNFPRVRVQILSHALWRDGPDACYRTVFGWITAHLHAQEAPEAPRAIVSRLDICVDVEDFGIREEHRADFTTRAIDVRRFDQRRRWDDQHEGETLPPVDRPAKGDKKRAEWEQLDATTYWQRLDFTGFTWGTRGKGGRNLLARLYNKSIEIKRSGKPWFHGVWRRGGWQGGPIFRLEYELGREVLKKMDITLANGQQLAASDPAEVLAALPELWAYLAGAPGSHTGWLVWREENDSPQRTRWDVHPTWEKIRAADFGRQAAGEVVRRRRARATVDQLIPQITGCIVSACAAQRLEGLTFGESFQWIGQRCADYIREKEAPDAGMVEAITEGVGFEELVHRRAWALNEADSETRKELVDEARVAIETFRKQRDADRFAILEADEPTDTRRTALLDEDVAELDDLAGDAESVFRRLLQLTRNDESAAEEAAGDRFWSDFEEDDEP